MSPRIRFALFVILAQLAGCAGPPPLQPAAAPPPRDARTAGAIERVLGGEHRSAQHRARDAWRHPLETLLFFGITPDMTVCEIWPGPDGWYTEILAPLLADGGKLYVAQMPAAPGNEYITDSRAHYSQKLAARPELYGRVSVTTLGADPGGIAPPGSCDLVVTFRNLHNWMNLGYAQQAFANMNRALKPGGILGVVEHRGDPGKPQDPRAGTGYVNEEFAIRLIESAGFELVERSEINANPKDTRDYDQGVWSLPPTLRQGSRDRERLEAIGESDRFTLRFRRR
jgi:predicted methyltransferase